MASVQQAASHYEDRLLEGMQGLTYIQEDETAMVCDDNPAQCTCRAITASTSQQVVEHQPVGCSLLLHGTEAGTCSKQQSLLPISQGSTPAFIVTKAILLSHDW